MTDDTAVVEGDDGVGAALEQAEHVTDGELDAEGQGTDQDATGEDAEGRDEEGDGSEPEAEEPEEVEIDFGGNKRSFKKSATVGEIAQELQGFSKSLYADYTQKTQKVAERAKALDARAEEINIVGEATNEYATHYGTALVAGQRLEQLRQIDLNQLWATDPDQARRISDEMRQTEGIIASLSSDMKRIEGETKAKINELQQKRMEEGKKLIHARVPDFETKYAADVIKYVTSNYSVSEDQAKLWALSPDVTLMAMKAMLYDRSKAQAKSPPKVKAVETPVTPVKGKGTVKRLDPASPESDGLSDAEWFALRNKQVSQRR